MDPAERNLSLALIVSLLLHAVLLSIHFKLPEMLAKASENALEVILVNSKSPNKPVKAQAKAQNNLDGGGNTEEDRRAKTPLPPSKRDVTGDELIETRRRIAELEAQSQEVLTQLKSNRSLANEKHKLDATPAPSPAINGADLASTALAIARIEGQIARQLEDYNQRPRKKFLGARTEEYRFAQYVEDWRQKIERVGNLNYPEAARGKAYGSLVLTVIIRASGDVERVEINRSSGNQILDNAARRIVLLAAPYAAFPASITRDTDVLEITRTWTFTNSDRLHAD
ncbi:MAG: TonB family protein [Rhodocyclaceae bacterium]|nr:TonB family protein [Rhodocyclaceae bacterium]